MAQDIYADFPSISAKQWKQFLQFSLDGLSYENLLSSTRDQLTIKPFYHADDLSANFLLPSPEHCLDYDRLIALSAEQLIAQIKKAQHNGVKGFWVKIISDQIDLKSVFEAIDLPSTPLFIECNFLSSAYLQKALSLLQHTNHRVKFGIDPIGHLSKTGNWYKSINDDLAETISLFQTHNPTFALAIDLSIFQEAGATIPQQLTYSTAILNDYLNRLPETLKTCSVCFKVAIGSHFNFEIAKLKALRLLTQQLSDFYNKKCLIEIIAFPTTYNKTIFSNALNATRIHAEYQAAFLGGANAICCLSEHFILPKDKTKEQEKAQSKLQRALQLSENPQLIQGSYYINEVTKQLAEKALDLLKTIEKGGGYLAQLKAGKIQQKIKESAHQDRVALKNKTRNIVDCNVYQNKSEHFSPKAIQQLIKKANPHKTLLAPIVPKRLAITLELNRLCED